MNLSELLNNQPNGVRIGCSRYICADIVNTPFHHLSRRQQMEQVNNMIACGIDWCDLQTELYLVAHLPTWRVWDAFGIPMIGDSTDNSTSSTEEVETTDDECFDEN